jgi:hypothetical protein
VSRDPALGGSGAAAGILAGMEPMERHGDTDRRRIVVALDGPASSGKSSVGAAAAERLGLRFVDTGLLYRALTAFALREGVATDDAPGLVALVGRIALADDGSGRLNRVLLDGEDAGDSPDEVDAAVSAVARARGHRPSPSAGTPKWRDRGGRARHRTVVLRRGPQAVPRCLGGGRAAAG